LKFIAILLHGELRSHIDCSNDAPEENGMMFIKEVERRLPVIQEYYRLVCQPTLSEREADRLQEILEQAQQDLMLDFLIDEFDHILGHELGLIHEKFIQEQQDRLKPLIDSIWVENQVRTQEKDADCSIEFFNLEPGFS
jgi:hypothetical protein